MPPRRTKQRTLTASPSSSSSSLSPSAGPSRRKRTRRAPSADKASDTDSDVAAIRFEPDHADTSDHDPSPRRPKRWKTALGSASDDATEETTGRRTASANVVLDSEDDDVPRKRKFTRGIRPPSPEGDDDTVDAGNMLESRLRSRGKMTAFQKNLEKLKLLKDRKRSELTIESSSEPDSQSESPDDVPFKGAKPHHSGDSDVSHGDTDSSGEEDDSFIVDDALGGPAAQLPLAFSLSTHQDLTHQFKVVCQLFVHIAVRPLAQRRPFLERVLNEEEYLSIPLQVTRRKLSGMRDSLVASSVWKSEFKKALETYPEFTLIRLKFAVSQCDACNLGSRSSTFIGRLSGNPYDRCDFEDLSDDESDEDSEEDGDEDEDEDGDKDEDGESDVDSDGDARHKFHLGRHCAARTQVYHQFSHWEYSLYKSLQREITEARDKTRHFVKVAYSGGIQPPRDPYDADSVMEWLDERGIIDLEWQKVRQMMDGARGLERGDLAGDV